MEKNKNRVFKLLGLLVVVFLVCLCMLGSTFARYTTGGSATGTAYVSKWIVSVNGGVTSKTVTIGEFSPMLYNNSTSEEYYNTSASGDNGIKYTNIVYAEVAEISIQADVDAEITLVYSDITIKSRTTDTYYVSSSSTGSYIYLNGSGDLPSYDSVFDTSDGSSSVLTLGFCYTTDGSDPLTSATSEVSSSITGSSPYYSGTYGYTLPTLNKISDTGTTLYYMGSDTSSSYSGTGYINSSAGEATTIKIYAYVTWTSDYNSATSASTVDSLDTWIGTNIDSISAVLSCQAVQAQTVTINNSTGSNS